MPSTQLQYKWPVVGHVKQLLEMEEDLRQGRLSHAYLLNGPSQIGKRLVARTFAQILQCENKNFCRTCITCKHIEKGHHIETIELRDDGEPITIEQIRDLLSHLSITHSARYKIVIIQNLERISPNSANTLLKTLEEPRPGVIFLMTTTHSHELLDTILSRARLITFHALPESTIREQLQETLSDMESSTLEMMAAFSMGRPGRALQFSNDPDRFRFYQDIYQHITKFFEYSRLTDRMIYVEEIAKEPESLDAFFELFYHVVRGSIFQKLEGKQIPYRFDQLFGMIEYLNQARFDIDHNLNSRMVLENLMMKL